jgi:hypothetical protein
MQRVQNVHTGPSAQAWTLAAASATMSGSGEEKWGALRTSGGKWQFQARVTVK